MVWELKASRFDEFVERGVIVLDEDTPWYNGYDFLRDNHTWVVTFGRHLWDACTTKSDAVELANWLQNSKLGRVWGAHVWHLVPDYVNADGC